MKTQECIAEYKVCEICNSEKEIEYFYVCNGYVQKYCLDCKRNKSREHYRGNKQSYKDRAKEWSKANPEHRKEIVNFSGRKISAATNHAKTKKRRELEKRATPSWCNTKVIRMYVIEAKNRTRQTGIVHEVDHFYPIDSPLVCGLHVPENIRIITRAENKLKHNKLIDFDDIVPSTARVVETCN
jgi:hypothetical protein